MLDRKNKNKTLTYGELIMKILVYTGFNFEEEEQKNVHLKIGKRILSEMRYTIQGRDIVALLYEG